MSLCRYLFLLYDKINWKAAKAADIGKQRDKHKKVKEKEHERKNIA